MDRLDAVACGAMARLPVICNSCGHVWPSSFEMTPGAANNTFIGNTHGPCPRCAGVGRIADGVYSTTASNEIEAILRHPIDASILQRYADRLHQLEQRGTTDPAQVRAAVADAPAEVQNLVDRVLGERVTVGNGLRAIVAILMLWYAYKAAVAAETQVDLTREQLRRDQTIQQMQAELDRVTEPLTSPPESTTIAVPPPDAPPADAQPSTPGSPTAEQ